MVLVDATATTFLGNSALREGGALCLSNNGGVVCDRCIFANNSAANGGGISAGISAEEGTISGLLIRNSSFRYNSATRGAAIDHYGTVNATDTDFVGNVADTGAALNLGYQSDDTPLSRLTSCRFVGNAADSRGGSIALETIGAVSLEHSTFEGNIANSSGAALVLLQQSGPVGIRNCDFVHNRAQSGGGGAVAVVHNADLKQLKVQGCLFQENKV